MSTTCLPQVLTTRAPGDGRHNEALVRLFRRLGELSSLPTVLQRILSVASDCRSGADDLTEVVECDPTLAIRILKAVNSGYYCLRNEVSDLKMAIALLGFREVRNLALTVYVARLFRDSVNIGGYTREGLWNHMVAVGSIARVVSQVCRKSTPDEAYMAGLIHDVGWILIDQFLHRHFRRILERLDEGTFVTCVEQQQLSFDHTDLGAFLARESNFPDCISDAIQHHHHPDTYHGPHQDLLYVVVLANYLAARQGITSLGVNCVPAPSDNVCAILGLRSTDLSEIWEATKRTLEKSDVIAGI